MKEKNYYSHVQLIHCCKNNRDTTILKSNFAVYIKIMMFYSFNPSISPREFYKTETFPPVTQDTNVVVVVWSCPSLSNAMDCSMPGFLVFHYLQEFSQTHVL